MPESVRDRPTTSHEHMFLLTKSARYFYDSTAVREGTVYPNDSRKPYAPGQVDNRGNGHDRGGGQPTGRDTSGRNLRSVWTINPGNWKGAHFATFPPALVTPCISAGSSSRGCCPECGGPWRRITERGGVLYDGNRSDKTIYTGQAYGDRSQSGVRGPARNLCGSTSTTTGWAPTCECDAGDPVPCRTLDPFGGVGTVALVARQLGRDCDIIELNPTYAEMAQQRLDQTPVHTVETGAGAVEVQQIPMFSEVTVREG